MYRVSTHPNTKVAVTVTQDNTRLQQQQQQQQEQREREEAAVQRNQEVINDLLEQIEIPMDANAPPPLPDFEDLQAAGGRRRLCADEDHLSSSNLDEDGVDTSLNSSTASAMPDKEKDQSCMLPESNLPTPCPSPPPQPPSSPKPTSTPLKENTLEKSLMDFLNEPIGDDKNGDTRGVQSRIGIMLYFSKKNNI